MAITAAGRARHETITLRHGDEEGQVTIDPSVMTTAVQIELQKIDDAAEQTEFLIDILCDLIIKWEVEDDNGDPLPITEESMLALESRLVWSIYTGIREAREDEGKASGRGSSRKGSTGRARSGTR